ncbi:MAG: 1-hydroxycarotenoid 3,4-desaturase CrtD [Pseudomonadota bacterium]
MSAPRVIVVGAGIGGLSAALSLAARRFNVTVVERHGQPGGKMREIDVAGRAIDSGPTVFTMRWIFEALFRDAGLTLADHVTLHRAGLVARHGWLDGSRLDLYSDVERSAAAVAQLAGEREADAYRRFSRDSAAMFDTLDASFMRAEKPSPFGLTRSLGLAGLPQLIATKPYVSLWRELGRRFTDPRLRQLFARYSTYCGSSPLRAPATLMLIAHAERAGVWYVDGGMQRLAEALSSAATLRGARFRFGSGVRRILVGDGRVRGVLTDTDERLEADAVVFNGDVAALADGLLGDTARAAPRPRRPRGRSLSALTLSMVARAGGFPLAHHTVFFGENYPDEFDAIFRRGEVTAVPTVYVCAQDRGSGGSDGQAERLFCLLNAPPGAMSAGRADELESRLLDTLRRHGLNIDGIAGRVRTTPGDFGRHFPGTAGALYGTPTHGFNGSFARPGSRARIGGLYFAGGSVHPGPGVPMTAQSGRLAAASIARDLGFV